MDREKIAPDDYISRAEVLRICRELGSQSADLALYGAPENARSREAMEAAATRIGCAIALMPTLPSSPPDVAGIVERLECSVEELRQCVDYWDTEGITENQVLVAAQTMAEAVTALQSLSHSLASNDAEIERLTKERDGWKAGYDRLHSLDQRTYHERNEAESEVTQLRARIAEMEKALEPFALAVHEGVVKQETGYVTITTCAEYFHRARLARQGAKPKQRLRPQCEDCPTDGQPCSRCLQAILGAKP